MDTTNRQDEFDLIAAMLTDVHRTHVALFNNKSLRCTIGIVRKRIRHEGLGFLTKTLPKLGKAFDKALTLDTPLNGTKHDFQVMPDSKLPRFLGEFFSLVLDPTGVPLQGARAEHVAVIRQVLYLFYKYELPYTAVQEQEVISKFVKTDSDLLPLHGQFADISAAVNLLHSFPSRNGSELCRIVRNARITLSRVFRDIDLTDIVPRHGPGAVATKQLPWDKYRWTNVSSRLTSTFPFDAYFCASLGHVVDTYRSFDRIGDKDLPARVVLVPKDSRGPRLISCEPVDFQWIQQGIMSKLVEHLENSPLTRENVRFTDQVPNQVGALYGSCSGKYATLDLNEASDRVSLDLVRLLFPPHVCEVLEAARSTATTLPNGEVIKLNKFAPMGSALCFPVLALVVWSLLDGGVDDVYTRERIYVYGDDVIVPAQYAQNAMNILESFGLKINRDKSCLKGFFRESCGVDAFKGINVTPVRFRTVWSSVPSPESYTSWIAYANSMYDKKYYTVYDTIVNRLGRIYGRICSDDMHLACPSLREVPESMRINRSRVNRSLQKREWFVRTIDSPKITKTLPGWTMLLRYFTEASRPSNQVKFSNSDSKESLLFSPFSVRQYTRRRTSMLVRRWR